MFLFPVDPYTCLVSGIQGLTLGGGAGAHPSGTQFVQGPLGYPGMCVINTGQASYASLPNMEPHSAQQQARVATKILRRLSVGIVKESSIKGEG